MRGGDLVEVRRVFATPKARAVYESLSATGSVEDVFPEVGGSVRLMADGSPYFVHDAGVWRVVLCVAHGKQADDGVFAVVNVERRWADDKRAKRRG
jgi:hypothetical protein